MAGDLAADLATFANSFNSSLGQNDSDWVHGSPLPACWWSGIQCYQNNGTSGFTVTLSDLRLSGEHQPYITRCTSHLAPLVSSCNSASCAQAA